MSELTEEQKLAELRVIVAKSKDQVAKGKSAIALKFGSDLKPLEFISSGILELDQLCGSYVGDDKNRTWSGRGGPVLRGRWVIWWGGMGSGKTTEALHMVAQAQEQGLVCGYFNSERALDPVWALKRGVNLEKLLIWEGGNLEQNLDSLIEILDRGLVDFIIIDTIHAFAMKADTEGKEKARGMVDEIPQGRLADRLTRFFRIATARVDNANAAILLIGQARQNEDWEQLTGGHALKHYVSLNLHFQRLSKSHSLTPTRTVPKASGDGNEKVPIGYVMKITVDKTRTNHRDQDHIEIPFLWGLGPDNFEMNVFAAVKLGIIKQASSYYTLPTAQGDMKLQGREQLMEWMRANQPYYEWLLATVTGNFQEPADRAAQVEEPEPELEKKKGKKS